MKKLVWCSLCFSLLMALHLSLQADEVISRNGWSYDRQGFSELPVKVEEAKKANKGISLRGWAEYDIKIPKTGWYELWLGGCPMGWPRDILVDGKLTARLQLSETGDALEPMPKTGIQFKEMNLFLREGNHALRLQRYSPPGALPTIWELRPSSGKAGESIRAVVEQSRIVEPGGSVAVKFLGGGSSPFRYDLLWRNESTEEIVEAGSVDFPASGEPVEKSVTLKMPDAGLYSLRAMSGGEMLRPSDLKAGYFLSAHQPGNSGGSGGVQSQEFQMAGIFRDGAVLQRQKPLPVWGWSAPGDEVTVTLNGQKEKATADPRGRWQVTFKPMEAEKSTELTAESGNKTIVFKNIGIGEVWLLSGQSNMGGPLLTSTGGEEVAQKANYPGVRLTLISGGPAGEPNQRLNPAGWQDAVSNGNPETLKKWIAIHFTFGTELYEELKVPVGLVGANRGGTYLSSWASRDTHEKNPSLKKMLDAYLAEDRDRVQESIHLNKLAASLGKWKKDKKGPEPVMAPMAFRQNYPALHYDSMIKPLAPFAIRGILWYQGENDSGMAEAYRERFPALIRSWRDLWKEQDLPFIFVQVAYGNGNAFQGEPGDFQGAELKEAQTLTLSVPHTAMVVTDDLMKPGDDVHYPNKIPVGHRLALASLAKVYGKDIEYSGPIYKSQKIESSKIRLFFDHAKGGLQAKGGKLGGFAIAGEDKKWVWADAEIDGETVLVSSSKVSNPVAVRYSWAENPCGGNLFNKADLPAAVFRTDDWPMVTAGVDYDQRY